MWREDGMLVATSIQDGLVRLRRDDGFGKAGFSPEGMIKEVEEAARKAKTREKGKL